MCARVCDPEKETLVYIYRAIRAEGYDRAGARAFCDRKRPRIDRVVIFTWTPAFSAAYFCLFVNVAIKV